MLVNHSMESLRKLPTTLNSVFPNKSLQFSVRFVFTAHLNCTSLMSRAQQLQAAAI